MNLVRELEDKWTEDVGNGFQSDGPIIWDQSRGVAGGGQGDEKGKEGERREKQREG